MILLSRGVKKETEISRCLFFNNAISQSIRQHEKVTFLDYEALLFNSFNSDEEKV